jgi:uncharacterized protein YbbK (DUF523 family)
MQWTAGRLVELESLGLCGYICKENSPSCSGHGRAGVFGASSTVPQKGTGIFTKAFIEHFPRIPVIEEGSLEDPAARNDFLGKVLACRQNMLE